MQVHRVSNVGGGGHGVMKRAACVGYACLYDCLSFSLPTIFTTTRRHGHRIMLNVDLVSLSSLYDIRHERGTYVRQAATTSRKIIRI